MLKEIRPAIVLLVVLTAITGLIYPLAMTGIAGAIFPYQAQGSLIEKDGKVIGSALIGQVFTDDKYFHGRPSATTAPDPKDSTKTVRAPYNAANSGGSNLGPTNKALIDRVKEDVDKLKEENAIRTGSDRSGDHDSQRSRSAHLAGRRAFPGAARCQGAQHAGRSRASARQRQHRGSLPRPARRAARERAGAEPGAGQSAADSRAGLPAEEPEAEWQISGAILISDLHPKPCSKRPGAKRAALASSRYSSVRRPASARPTRCCSRRVPERRTATTSSSASSKLTGAKKPKRCWTGSKSFRAGALEYKGQWLDEMDLDAIIARRPQIVLVDELAHTNAPGSRHPKRYLDVEELLEPRHPRLHHGQYPAHRKPERRRRADHARARARDRTGFRLRSRRRRRTGRSDAGRPDRAAQGREGLRPETGRARAGALFFAQQSDRVARAGACAAPPTGSTSNCSPKCRHAPFRGRGRRASAFLSASAKTRAPRGSCAMPSAWRTACMALGSRSTWKAGAASSSTMNSATASPTRCGSPSRSAARRSPFRAPAVSPTT